MKQTPPNLRQEGFGLPRTRAAWVQAKASEELTSRAGVISHSAV
jgi:hypothetical protein